MYPITLIGATPTAHIAAAALRIAGFEDITQVDAHPCITERSPGLTLGANITRVLAATGALDAVQAVANQPTREQVRLARSAYLISELPLGQFTQDRYRAPHLNIEAEALSVALTQLQADSLRQAATQAPESRLTIDARSAVAPWCPPGYQMAWHEDEAGDQQANITWLGADCVAWQYSTATKKHTIFCARTTHALEPQAWHPSLAAAVREAQPLPHGQNNQVRDYLYEGDLVFVGNPCFPGSWFYREAQLTGAEDAWVLSRMLENYEEDIADGLGEYHKYRRARLTRLARLTTQRADTYLQASPAKRTLRNLNLAFSSRFMPEIAMQRIDWLYNYDCIRGFR